MTCDEIELTAEERRAISALKRIAKRWPQSLWLFSASGTLNVMKKSEGGSVGSEAPDPARSVATIEIENDGGDW